MASRAAIHATALVVFTRTGAANRNLAQGTPCRCNPLQLCNFKPMADPALLRSSALAVKVIPATVRPSCGCCGHRREESFADWRSAVLRTDLRSAILERTG